MRISSIETKGVIFDLQGTLLSGFDRQTLLLRKDLQPALNWLAASRKKLGVTTSGTEHKTKQVLEWAGVAAYFDPDYIVGSGSLRPLHKEVSVRQRSKGLKGLLGATDTVQVPTITREVLSTKPHPAAIEYILAHWHVPPESVVYIGDSDIDAEHAQAASVPFRQIDDIHKGTSLLDFLQCID